MVNHSKLEALFEFDDKGQVDLVCVGYQRRTLNQIVGNSKKYMRIIPIRDSENEKGLEKVLKDVEEVFVILCLDNDIHSILGSSLLKDEAEKSFSHCKKFFSGELMLKRYVLSGDGSDDGSSDEPNDESNDGSEYY